MHILQRSKKSIISKFILFPVFALLVLNQYASAAGQEIGGGMKNIVDQVKKTVVFIGYFDEEKKPHFVATGFLVQVENIFHLITAKHVVMDKKTHKFKDGKMVIFFNSNDKKIVGRSINMIKQKFDVDWILHNNEEVDIAMIPIPLNTKEDDVKVVPDNLFTASDRIFELYDIFFLSYQPGIEPKSRISPIFRSGVISIINDDRTFYVDAAVFPGNSGSPVFLKPSPIRFDEKTISIGSDKLGGTFIGIVGEYIPYSEVAISQQTGRPRVVFEENTGLSKVWPVEFIKEILTSEAFKKQLNRVKNTIPSPNRDIPNS